MTNRQRIRLSLGALRTARFSELPALGTFIVMSAAMILLRRQTARKWRFDFDGHHLALGICGASGFNFLMEVIGNRAYRSFIPSLSAKRDHVVIDCGANVGFFALWARRQNSGLTIYALEPHPTTFQSLIEHVRMNGAQGAIIPENIAVGSEVGTIELHTAPDTNMAVGGNVSGDPVARSYTTVRMPTTSLDAFAERHGIRPTLLKIDVEGFELDVLKGAQRILPGVMGVILEAHTPELVRSCTEELERHGFTVSHVDGLVLAERPRGGPQPADSA